MTRPCAALSAWQPSLAQVGSVCWQRLQVGGIPGRTTRQEAPQTASPAPCDGFAYRLRQLVSRFAKSGKLCSCAADT